MPVLKLINKLGLSWAKLSCQLGFGLLLPFIA